MVLVLTIWCPRLSCAHFCDMTQHTHGRHRRKHLSEFIWIFQALLLIARALSGIPYIAVDNVAPYVTRMLLHCLHLWCYLVRCYLLHTMSVRDQQSTCQACSITGPAYFFFVSPHTECYKVYLMSSFTLAFHWLSDFISMAVWHTGTPVPVCHIMLHWQLVVPINWGRGSSLVVQWYLAVYFNWTCACSALQILLLDNFIIWLLSSSLDYLSSCLFRKFNLLFWVSCLLSCTIL